MIDDRFYRKYQGETAYYFYEREGSGLIIWEGFFEALMNACFESPAATGGLLEAWAIGDALFDEEVWEIPNLALAIDEINQYDPARLGAYGWAAPKMDEVKDVLLKLLGSAMKEHQSVKVEMF